ncbi:MAG: hypothetical protein WCJ49_02425 [Deltaproteobacteria bacterium]
MKNTSNNNLVRSDYRWFDSVFPPKSRNNKPKSKWSDEDGTI